MPPYFTYALWYSSRRLYNGPLEVSAVGEQNFEWCPRPRDKNGCLIGIDIHDSSVPTLRRTELMSEDDKGPDPKVSQARKGIRDMSFIAWGYVISKLTLFHDEFGPPAVNQGLRVN